MEMSSFADSSPLFGTGTYGLRAGIDYGIFIVPHLHAAAVTRAPNFSRLSLKTAPFSNKGY